LATKDRREADRRFHAAMTKLNTEFEAAERQLHAAEEEAQQMASDRAEAALGKLAKLTGQSGFVPTAWDDKDMIAEALGYGQFQARPKSRPRLSK
jgi:hypothetical protein